MAALAGVCFVIGSCRTTSGPPGFKGKPPALDVPRAGVAPRVDANPGDPAWAFAAVIPALSMSLGPDAEGLSPVPTEVRLLWDADCLYVRFLCEDDEAYSPHDRRDAPHHEGDVVELFLDPVGDGRQYVELQVSPRNQVLDQLIFVTADPACLEDGRLTDEIALRDWWAHIEWDMPGLRTATGRLARGADGWIADIAVPAFPLLRRLGLSSFQPMNLRAHVMRYDRPRLSSQDAGAQTPARAFIAMNWAPVAYGCPHISPAAMGTLRLVEAGAE